MTDREAEAGRAMDALIEQAVFGREVEFLYWSPEFGGDLSDVIYAGSAGECIPDYSTRIEDAWQVVEHLHAQGWQWHIAYNGESRHDFMVTIWQYEGDLIPEDMDFAGDADTAPLALCRAALAAVDDARPADGRGGSVRGEEG